MKASIGSSRLNVVAGALLLLMVRNGQSFPTCTANARNLSSPNSLAACRSRKHMLLGDRPFDELSAKSNARMMRQNIFRRFSPKTTLQAKGSNLSNDDKSQSQAETNFLGLPKDAEVTGPLLLLLFSQFILFLGVGAVIPSIPLYGKELGLSGAANGIVISAPAVALVLGARFAGSFADLARKPAMLIGMALIVVSDLGTAMARNIFVLIIARLGLGLGRCVSESGERGYLADLCNRAPAVRGRALAAQQAVFALGIAIGSPLGGSIVESFGPRAAFLCVSVAAAVTLVLYGLLPETITGGKNQGKAKMNSKQDKVDESKWSDLLSQNVWRGLAICQCGASVGFAAKIASIPIIAASVLPGGAAGAGALLSAAGLSGLIGAPIGGWLTDRTNAKSTAIISGIVAGIGLVLVPFSLGFTGNFLSSIPLLSSLPISSSGLLFCGSVILWSMAVAAQGPALTAFAQTIAPPDSKATALALPRAAGDGTYIVAPFLLGLISDKVFTNVSGLDCAVAGIAGILGAIVLSVLGNDETENTKKA